MEAMTMITVTSENYVGEFYTPMLNCVKLVRGETSAEEFVSTVNKVMEESNKWDKQSLFHIGQLPIWVDDPHIVWLAPHQDVELEDSTVDKVREFILKI
jgi:acyl-homoserine lactone acylase PvdQ